MADGAADPLAEAVERFRGLVKLEAGLYEQGIRTKEPERRVGVLVETAVAVLAALDAERAAALARAEAAEAAIAAARAKVGALDSNNVTPPEKEERYSFRMGYAFAIIDAAAALETETP